ncbi:MAG: hypothetical protein HZC11_06665 [Nitrospirae bacterium]|nr:hypothetical protein [Nitrospirota bacterium]
METIRERILANIKTTLEGITQGNGYNFDFASQTVQRWSMHGNTPVDIPMIIITPGDELEEPSVHPFSECTLSIFLSVFYINDKNDAVPTDTYLNRLQGDIKKVVLLDHTRGGEAIDTDIVSTSPFVTTEGQHYAGLVIELKVKYRHLRNDPTRR